MSGEPPFRAIAESTYDLETWVDEAGVVRWVNRAAERFLGVGVASCLTMPSFPLPFVHPSDRGLFESVMTRAANGESGNDIEFRLVAGDEAPRWVSVSFQPPVDDGGRSRGYRTSIRDIELRKDSERKLADAERTAARIAAERTQLLATLSHELRTPIHCIAGFTELLLDSDDPVRRTRFLELIADQSSGALRLVEDLLLFAAGTARESLLRDAPFDLDALVAAQVDALRIRAADEVEVRIDATLGARRWRLGDADRVRQMVSNLVSNALRFTERGTVRVSVGELRTSASPDEVEIRVADTGVGMDEQVLERAREAFVQAEPRSITGRGGVGLGLAIVDDLASLLGGTLSLESATGVGTVATVRLRLPTVLEGDAPREATISAAARRLRVLVVDDVPASRELLAAMFDSVGIRPSLAASGEKAIELCAREYPELVVVDYHMPGMDGLETARRIGEIAAARERKPFVVVLTADVLAGGSHPEVDAWLTKPLRRAELVRLLERATVRDVDSGIDPTQLDELEAVIDRSGRSLLATKGPSLLAAMVESAGRLAAAKGDDARREIAHELRGLSATLGARSIERFSARIEASPADEDAARELARWIEPARRAILTRIAAARSPA